MAKQVGKLLKGPYESHWQRHLVESVEDGFLWRDEQAPLVYSLTRKGLRTIRDIKNNIRPSEYNSPEDKTRYVLHILKRKTGPAHKMTKTDLLLENRILRGTNGQRGTPLSRVSSFSTASENDQEVEQELSGPPTEPNSPIRNAFRHLNPTHAYPSPQSAPRLGRNPTLPTLPQESPSRPPRRQASAAQAGPSRFVDSGGLSVNSRLTAPGAQEPSAEYVPMDVDEPVSGGLSQDAECQRLQRELTTAKDELKTFRDKIDALEQKERTLTASDADKDLELQQLKKEERQNKLKICKLAQDLMTADTRRKALIEEHETLLRVQEGKLMYLATEFGKTQVQLDDSKAQLDQTKVQLRESEERATSTTTLFATLATSAVMSNVTLQEERRLRAEANVRRDQAEREAGLLNTQLQRIRASSGYLWRQMFQ